MKTWAEDFFSRFGSGSVSHFPYFNDKEHDPVSEIPEQEAEARKLDSVGEFRRAEELRKAEQEAESRWPWTDHIMRRGMSGSEYQVEVVPREVAEDALAKAEARERKLLDWIRAKLYAEDWSTDEVEDQLRAIQATQTSSERKAEDGAGKPWPTARPQNDLFG